MGELTNDFQVKWAEYIGTKRSIFVNSGSSANLLMVYLGIVLGRLKQGDKVIVPSCGWATTISPIIQLGLTPIMVDANRYNFGVNIDEVESLCKKENINGMIFVHPLGVPCDKAEITYIKDKYDLFSWKIAAPQLVHDFLMVQKLGLLVMYPHSLFILVTNSLQ